MEWQPIETAPKDGTFIDAYNATNGWRCVVCWGPFETWDRKKEEMRPGGERWISPVPVFDVAGWMTFTHWLPLPRAECA